MFDTSYASIRRGGWASPRASPSSARARDRAAKSEARFSLWRRNASFAFVVTTRRRRRLSPRSGSAIRIALPVELLEEGGHQRRRVEVLNPVHHPAPPPCDPSPADEEHLEGRLEVVLIEPDHVEVLPWRQHHLLGLDGLPRSGQTVPEPGGLLVLLGGRSRAHLGLQLPEDGAVVAGQEVEMG